MEKAISQRELRNDSEAVMRAVEAGESFIVTRNGVPLAQLTPLRRRTFVPREEAFGFCGPDHRSMLSASEPTSTKAST